MSLSYVRSLWHKHLLLAAATPVTHTVCRCLCLIVSLATQSFPCCFCLFRTLFNPYQVLPPYHCWFHPSCLLLYSCPHTASTSAYKWPVTAAAYSFSLVQGLVTMLRMRSFLLFFVLITGGSTSVLEGRDSCGKGYEPCSPKGASDATEDVVHLYNNLVNSVATADHFKRHAAPTRGLVERAKPAPLCCGCHQG